MKLSILATTALAGGFALGGVAHAQVVSGAVGGVTNGGVSVSAPGVNVGAGIGASGGAFGGASPGLAPGGLGMAPGVSSMAPVPGGPSFGSVAPSSVSPRASGSGYAVGQAYAGANVNPGAIGAGRPAVHGPLPMPGAFPTVRWSETRQTARNTVADTRRHAASTADRGRTAAVRTRAAATGRAADVRDRAHSQVASVRDRADAATGRSRSATARLQAETRAVTPVAHAGGKLNGAASARTPGVRATEPADRVTARLNREAARGRTLATTKVSNAAADSRALTARIRAAADESADIRSRLASLSPGMVVRDTRGQRVGVVNRIVRSGGTIRSVMVTAADGARRMALSPTSLSVSGGVVTTTQFGAR